MMNVEVSNIFEFMITTTFNDNYNNNDVIISYKMSNIMLLLVTTENSKQ